MDHLWIVSSARPPYRYGGLLEAVSIFIFIFVYLTAISIWRSIHFTRGAPHEHSHRPQHSTAQHSDSTAQHSTAQHSTAQHSTAQHSTYHSTATAQHNAAQRTAQAQDLDQRDVKASQLRPNMIESMQDTPIRNVVLSVCISFCVKLCTRKFS